MTNDEAKEAFRNKTPVYFNGVQYSRISAIIYRYDQYDNHMLVSAELLDRNGHSVVIARISDIKGEGQ